MSEKDKSRYFDIVEYNPKAWRNGAKPKAPKEGETVGWIVGLLKNKKEAYVSRHDYNLLNIAPPGGGKTNKWCVENMEWQMANGISFVVTDTKGIYRKIKPIAEKYYGYKVVVYDFRNCIDSDKNNIMSLVNHYTDLYEETKNIRYKSIAERYALINAHTVIGLDKTSFGQNTFFYETAEGLLVASQLLVARYAKKEERHMRSVYSLISEANETIDENGDCALRDILRQLPLEDNTRFFGLIAFSKAAEATSSVLTTLLSKIRVFLDAELEQISSFGSSITGEELANGKCAVFIIIPEEDDTKYFYASLLINQLIGELLIVADQNSSKGDASLPNEVRFNCDEIGSIPRIDRLPQGLSAGRSRKMYFAVLLQSLYQLNQIYGNAADNMTDCMQLVIFGAMSPLSKTSDALSQALGKQTIESPNRSVNYTQNTILNTPSSSGDSVTLASRELMFSDEIKKLNKDEWVVYESPHDPAKMWLPWYETWGISFEGNYDLKSKEVMEVKVATAESIQNTVNESKVQKECIELAPEDLPEHDDKTGEIKEPKPKGKGKTHGVGSLKLSTQNISVDKGDN